MQNPNRETKRWLVEQAPRDALSPPSGPPPTPGRFYVISYDIPDDKRRYRISKALLGFGERVQRSVFECILRDEQLAELRGRLLKIAHPQDDNIRIYNLGAVSQADVEVHGAGRPTELPLVYIA